jgi:hypothetical protein
MVSLGSGIYLMVGLMLALAIDASPRHGRAVQNLPLSGELLALLLWPIALPLLIYTNQSRRRR